MIERRIQEKMNQFNAKVRSDRELQLAFQWKFRKMAVKLDDGEQYFWTLENGKMDRLMRTKDEPADIEITGDRETIEALLSGTGSYLMAHQMQKIDDNSKPEDALLVLEFFYRDIGHMLAEVISFINMAAQQKMQEEGGQDEAVIKVLMGLRRNIMLDFTGYKSYILRLENAQLLDFREGRFATPDVRVTTDVSIVRKIVNQELNPKDAIADGRIKIEASEDDMAMINEALNGMG